MKSFFNKLFGTKEAIEVVPTNADVIARINASDKEFKSRLDELHTLLQVTVDENQSQIEVARMSLTGTIESFYEEITTKMTTHSDSILVLKSEIENLLTSFIQTVQTQVAVNKNESVVEEVRLIASSLVEIRDSLKSTIENTETKIGFLNTQIEKCLPSEKMVSDIVGTVNNSNNKRAENIINSLNELKNKQEVANETIASSIGYLISKDQFEPTRPSGPLPLANRGQQKRRNKR